jgi:hypothetical protein
MFVMDETYAAIVGFVTGFDAACEGGPLEGFREWLLVRLNVRALDVLPWPALVLDAAFPATSPNERLVREEAHRHAIETLFDLLEEFDKARAERDGLRRILVSYTKWLKDTQPGA